MSIIEVPIYNLFKLYTLFEHYLCGIDLSICQVLNNPQNLKKLL